MKNGPHKDNSYSHLTAKERETISFPARVLNERNLLKKAILDFGCGHGKDVEVLKNKGHNITGYDPFYFPDYPKQKYDTILCLYVLNVLLPEEQVQVLMDVSMLLKPMGKAYFAVRRDIFNEGFRIHKVHKQPTYQCNIKLPYKSIFKNDTCEIYEYQHYTVLNKGKENVSPFFKDGVERDLIVESATAFSIFDKYPVSDGHALIIPKRVIADYFGLSLKHQKACWIMVNKVKEVLVKEFNPEGFNIGINVSEVAGQTVPHVHIHLIPRYNNDVKDPRGGIRNVIPEKGNYLK